MNKKFLNAVLFGALLASSAGTFTSCKDYDDDINGLQEQIDANNKTLDGKLATLQTAMDAAKLEVAAAKAAAAAAQTTADAAKIAAAAAAQAAAQAKVDAIAEATRLVNELKTVVAGKVDKTVYDAKMADIDNKLGVIQGDLITLKNAKDAMALQIDALEKFKGAIDELDLTTTYPLLKEQVNTLVADLKALQDKVAVNTIAIDELKTELGTLSDTVDSIQAGLNTLIDLLSHRLTALTFAPETFINGIETIEFTTLKYKAWTDLKGNITDGTASTSINDGATRATYYASPSSVKKEDVTELKVLTTNATNTITSTLTRAATPADITATIADEILYGKMLVNLKKNSSEPFTDQITEGKEKFILLALQAKVRLTADELDRGVSPYVTSDWARLKENAEVPYIHNKLATTEAPADAHFYAYKTIFDADPATTRDKFIVKNLAYNETQNLNDLIDVCDKTGTKRYIPENYGMKLEFALENYYLKEGSEEKTNQKEYASIDANGVISSQARNGTVGNRDAIGREPMIRVILRDMNLDQNGAARNKVVDVRYFKIKWTTERVNTPLGNIKTFTKTFDQTNCGQRYINIVGTAEMNDSIYTVAKENGIRKEEFHELYKLDTKVYDTEANAILGTTGVLNLGAIGEIADGSGTSATTFNLKWTLAIASNVITPAEYAAGKATRTVWSRYIRKSDDAETYTFQLTLNLNITKMAFVAGYHQTYWNETDATKLVNTNKDKVFHVNPAVIGDNVYGNSKFYDCQIATNLLNGYYKASGVTDVLDLVSNAQDAQFEFDATRLTADWTTTGDVLKYKGKVAAEIVGGSEIRLYEYPRPSAPGYNAIHGQPTKEARMLLDGKVPVKLVASYCNGDAGKLKAELDHFYVYFINPLEMKLADVEDTFKDLMSNGSTVEVEGLVRVKETFGEKRDINVSNHFNAYNIWYNIGDIVWDIDNAKTSLKLVNGNIVITDDAMASDWNLFESNYKLTANKPLSNVVTSLTFKNNSSSRLQQPFKIAVPVYIESKWNPTLFDAEKKYAILTVMPGDIK